MKTEETGIIKNRTKIEFPSPKCKDQKCLVCKGEMLCDTIDDSFTFDMPDSFGIVKIDKIKGNDWIWFCNSCTFCESEKDRKERMDKHECSLLFHNKQCKKTKLKGFMGNLVCPRAGKHDGEVKC